MTTPKPPAKKAPKPPTKAAAKPPAKKVTQVPAVGSAPKGVAKPNATDSAAVPAQRPAAETALGLLNPSKANGVTFTEIGSTGLKRSGGQILVEYLTALRGQQGRRVYTEMADNDPVISAGLFAFEQAIRGLDWRFATADIDPDDPDHDRKTEVADGNRWYVQSCLDDMNQPWGATLADIFEMARYGWSALEIVYKRRIGPEETDASRRSNHTDGGIGWRKWAPRNGDTLYAWLWDDDGGLAGMTQMDPYAMKGSVTIPIEKMLLFRTTTRGSNPEGKSLIRGCHRPWHFKRRIEEYEATGIERDLAGLPVAYVPAEYLMDDATPGQKAVAAMMRDIVENIKRNEQDGVLLPHLPDEHGNRQFELSLLSSEGQRQFDLDQTMARLDQRIAMALLADWIMLGHENVGSQSLGETKMTLWEMAVDALAAAIADVVTRHAVPRLLRLNGMDASLAPRLVYGDVKTADLSVIATYVQTLASASLLTPDASLEEYLREVAGLPEADNDLDEVHALPDPNDPVIDPKTGLPYPEGATAMTPQEQLQAQTEQQMALAEHGTTQTQTLAEHKAGLDAKAADHNAQIQAQHTDHQAQIAQQQAQAQAKAQAAQDNLAGDVAGARRTAGRPSGKPKPRGAKPKPRGAKP